MITKQEAFLDFIGAAGTQLVIPVYQRVYAWNEKQCDTLWADIQRAGRTGSAHFIGTLLYAPEPGAGAVKRRLDVIDGQQRTATLLLLLTALRDWMAEAGCALDGIDAADITRRYLHVDGAPAAVKLVLSRVDRATMDAVVEGTPLPKDEEELSANVAANYRRFRDRMGEGFSRADAEVIWRGIGALLIVSAVLDGDDRPQLIFESLNSKGLPLTTADLVRNLLLVNAGYDEQKRLYERYWQPIERLYADDPGSQRLNAALHGFLAVSAPKLRIGGKDEVYATFKTFLEDVYHGTLEELLIGLKGFCESFATKSGAAGAARAQAAAEFGISKPKDYIGSRKVFGD
ncbi:MAG TPA: DUF262 domain-containing protein [Candidatus Aphodovivens avistercoris]|nr:DUF262 domain-containing protein [Candidatus Aphodovivens avistercoris]